MRSPCILVTALFLVTTPAFTQEPGNLWDITTSMEMAGMNMPGRKQQVCAPVDAEGPDAMSGGNDECTVTDVQATPGRYSYQMQCPNGSGTGVMTYQGQDSFTSDVTMTMDGETMKMLTTGKRVGSCDASKMKKQVAAMQAQADASAKQACASAPEQMMPSLLKSLDCDPKYRQELCDRLGTTEGFSIVAARQPMGNADIDSGTLPAAASYCGVDPDSLREQLCDGAVASGEFTFIGDSCPAQAQVIAQRECAGRGYTTPPAEKYQTFCNAYAQDSMDGSLDSVSAEGAESAPATKPTATDTLKEGAKRLKGLFGR